MFKDCEKPLTAPAQQAGLDASALMASQEIAIDGLRIGLQLEGEGAQAELHANHLGCGTGGATLGRLPDRDLG